MFSAHVIIFERGDAWRRALRVCDPELGHKSTLGNVIETRSLVECRRELLAASASVLGLEFTPRDAAGVIGLLAEMPGFAPQGQAVVLAMPDAMPVAGWELLQAGAKHVITSKRRIGEFAQIARRHLGQMRWLAARSGGELPLEERIRADLPL